jgi:hypothetical protein
MVRKRKKIHSRPIVTGYLEKVSSAIFDKYRKVITDMTMGEQGLYALYRKNKLYYLGLASNLRNRINHHLKDRHSGKWTHFSLYIIRHPDHIKELESLLLRIAYPTGNNIKGKLKRSANFLPVLKRNMKRAALDEVQNIFKAFEQAKTDGVKRPKVSHIRKLNGKLEQPCKGLFNKVKRLYAYYKENEYKAYLFKSGRIKFDGKFYDSPSMAGCAVTGGKTMNGWTFWKATNEEGEMVKLSEFRK